MNKGYDKGILSRINMMLNLIIGKLSVNNNEISYFSFWAVKYLMLHNLQNVQRYCNVLLVKMS